MHKLIVKEVRLGKKGQFTIPKKIRDEDKLEEDDLLIVTHTTSGEIILHRKKEHLPEDVLLEASDILSP